MTEEQFLGLTPGQFTVLAKRHVEKVKKDTYEEDYRAAMIVHALLEPRRDSKRRPEPFTVEEFMPQRGEAGPAPRKEQTAEEQIAMLRARFGGG